MLPLLSIPARPAYAITESLYPRAYATLSPFGYSSTLILASTLT